jgi:hypothetical protein
MSEPTDIIQPAAVAAQITADAPRAEEKTAAKPESAAVEPPAGGSDATAPDGPRDSLGRLFDPKRFRANADGTPFLNALGRFMPRGGRKPRNGATAPETAPAQPPAAAAWTAEERAEAKTAQPPPGAESGNGATAPETAQPPPEVVTPSGTRRAAARAGTRLLYTGTGILTGNPEEAVPPEREDKELQDTAAYVLEAGGWNPSPLVAVGVLLLTYGVFVASRPKNQEALSARWRALWRRGAEKAVAAAGPARTVEPAQPTMAPGAGTPLATGQ